MLTSAEKAIVKPLMLADPNGLIAYNSGSLDAMAAFLNSIVDNNFWGWRTDVSRSDIYNKQNDLAVPIDDQFWNWTTYKNQSVAEQNAWVQMFMGDVANFSQQNLREGISKIFTGSAAATAQKNHCLAIGRRLLTFTEKALATGTGTKASPATMTFEGLVQANELIGF